MNLTEDYDIDSNCLRFWLSPKGKSVKCEDAHCYTAGDIILKLRPDYYDDDALDDADYLDDELLDMGWCKLRIPLDGDPMEVVYNVAPTDWQKKTIKLFAEKHECAVDDRSLENLGFGNANIVVGSTGVSRKLDKAIEHPYYRSNESKANSIVLSLLKESRVSAEDARANAGWEPGKHSNYRVVTPVEFRKECTKHKKQLAELGATLSAIHKADSLDNSVAFSFDLDKDGTEATVTVYVYEARYLIETRVGRADDLYVEQDFLDYIDTLLVKPKPYDPFDL